MTSQGATIEVVETSERGNVAASPTRPTGLWQRVHAAGPFASNVAMTMGANGLIAVMGLVTGPLCARLLGPAGRGELAALQNLYFFVATMAMLGMPEATLFFTAREKERRGAVLASGLCVASLAMPVFFVAGWFFMPRLLAAQSPTIIGIARWYLLGIPLYALVTIPQFALRGRNDLVRWNVSRILPGMIWVLILVAMALGSKPSPSVVAVAYLGTLAFVILPVGLLVRQKELGCFRPETKTSRSLLSYGLPLAGATIPTTLNLRLDQLLMAAWLPAESLGLYVVAVSWSSAITPALVAIGTVQFPRIAAADDVTQPLIIAQGLRLTMLIAAVLTIAGAVLTPFLVPLLFGKAFLGSVAVAVVLVFAGAVSGINVVLEESLRGLGKPKAVFTSEMAGLAVTVASLLLLLTRMGIMGAGIASVLGYLSTSLALVWSLRRYGCLEMNQLVLKRSDVMQMCNRIGALWA